MKLMQGAPLQRYYPLHDDARGRVRGMAQRKSLKIFKARVDLPVLIDPRIEGRRHVIRSLYAGR